MSVTPLGMVMQVKTSHSQNAPYPMEVTVLRMLTLVSLEFANAGSPTPVTGRFLPPNGIVLGMSTAARAPT
jgi:hypothetical protein